MHRKLQSIGIALVAVAAMGALAAPSAHAVKFKGGSTPAFLTGVQIAHEGDTAHVFLAANRKIVCKKASFIGSLGAAEVAELTLTPAYAECTASGLPATITMNGCDYVFHGGVGGGDQFLSGEVNIDCPAGKVIEIHIYSSAANHTSGTSLCTVTIGHVHNLSENVLENTTGAIPDDVDSTLEVGLIPDVVHGSALLCGPKESTATYLGGITLRAYKNGTHTELTSLTVVP